MRFGYLVLGAWVAVVGIIGHRHTAEIGGVAVPWGLILALFTTWAVVHATTLRHSIGGAWFAIGWIAVLLLERVLGRGSYLIPTDWMGWTFMAGGLALIAADVVWASRVKA